MQGLLGVGGFVRLVFVLGLLIVSSEAAAQEESPGVIVITASDDASSGAAIRIDGEPSGNVPLRKTLTPGRHLVQVGKRGFTTYSKWVDLVAGQVVTIPVALQASAPKTGSLLMTADVTGLAVYIDGQRRGGTPLVVDGLSEGEHVVEIKSPGEGYQAFSQVVTVKPDERTTVDATIRLAPDLGSLRVIANVPGSIIRLDGIEIGVAPAAKGGLSPGEHLVTAEASGYESVTQTVTVIAGRERVVSLRFTTPSTEIPRIFVRANVPEAVVTIDGEEYGNPPITIEPADIGTHSVVVRAPGYREVRRTCSVGRSRNCEIYAELNALGVPVRVEANVYDAQLYVDGELRGPVPWEGDLAVGIHQVEVRAEGHGNHVEQIRLQKSPRVRLIQVILTPAVDPRRVDKGRQGTRPQRLAAQHRHTRRRAESTGRGHPRSLDGMALVGLGWLARWADGFPRRWHFRANVRAPDGFHAQHEGGMAGFAKLLRRWRSPNWRRNRARAAGPERRQASDQQLFHQLGRDLQCSLPASWRLFGLDRRRLQQRSMGLRRSQ